MQLFPWWAWIIFAGVLAVAELHAPGSYLIWLALGAMITGVVGVATEVSLEAQIGIFALASAFSCAGGYFVYRGIGRRNRSEPLLNERNRSMIGRRGVVCEVIRNGEGKVRLGDSVWLAVGSDMAEGTAIVVSGVRGTKLHVNALSTANSADTR